MLEMAFSVPLVAGMVLALLGGFRSAARDTMAVFDFRGAAIGFLAGILIGFFYGMANGAALLLGWILNRFGHLAARRIVGEVDARFTYFPRLETTHGNAPEKAFFIALMGAGASIAPMVCARVLGDSVVGIAPDLSQLLWTVSTVTAAFNFFCLLPLWPLDGGRCAAIAIKSFWPRGEATATIALSGGIFALGVYLASPLLLGLALLSAWHRVRLPNQPAPERGMPLSHRALAISSYAFTLLVHFLGGLPLILRFL